MIMGVLLKMFLNNKNAGKIKVINNMQIKNVLNVEFR